MTERRRFNTSERVAAYLIADGECEGCGDELQPGWHGDHDVPYSLGGVTDVTNIRALCPRCNLEKGNKQMAEKLGDWPANIVLRRWQREAFDRFIRHELPNFLAVATPGAGKTIFAMRCAHLLLSGGKVDRVVVVVPSSHLRKQWVKAAHLCGIDLNGEFENADGREARDYHGIVVTYQAIGAYPDLHRGIAARSGNRTFVIFDEIHHAGTNRTWGDAILHAFDPAEFRLCISGTPFRRDDEQISFIRYEENRSVADYEYGYADALRDDVCRTVYFPAFEGEISWLSNDEMRTHSFGDELSDEEAGQRLRAALLAPTWMEDVIRDAHGELMRIREDEPNAGGLLIAMDQSHAKETAQLIQNVTGYDPVIAISEDEDASRRIVEFERGLSPWIVAVKMVSEGVDIPRLRVCVYATNITSELFFRQAIGRIVRRRSDEDTDAYFFIPKDKRLVEHALRVKHERDHVLREQREAVRQEMEEEDGGDVERPRGKAPIIAYDATARPDGAIHDGRAYDQALIEKLAPVARQLGIAAVKLAAHADDLLALLENQTPTQRPASEPAKASKDERKAQLRNVAKKLANRWAYILQSKTKKPYKDCIKYVGNSCLDAGHKSPRMADEDGLKRRIEYLSRKLQEAGDGSI